MTSQSNCANERREAGLPLSQCSACGMINDNVRQFHPLAACELFKHLKNGSVVDANMRYVVEYGMKAQKHGLSLDQAMNDVTALTYELK